MSKRYVNVSKAADLLGVCEETLRQWDKQGRLVPIRTQGNHRRYKIEDIEQLLNVASEENVSDDKVNVAVYCRVSSQDQKTKGDLERQSGRVLEYCVKQGYHVVESFSEVGSGMHDRRPKLRKLFKLVESGKIQKVVVEHKDRLCRFMYYFLVEYFESHNVEIEHVEEVLSKSYEKELVEDILSLMSSFSSKIYGRRSAENRRKKKQAGAK